MNEDNNTVRMLSTSIILFMLMHKLLCVIFIEMYILERKASEIQPGQHTSRCPPTQPPALLLYLLLGSSSI